MLNFERIASEALSDRNPFLVNFFKETHSMNPQANILTRQAIDEAACAIQSLIRGFTDDRTPRAVREDLQRARERLSAAMQATTDAIAFLVNL